MTLKEYLEKQIRYFSKIKQEEPVDSDAYSNLDGRVMAYTDILLTCADEVLNKKITDEVW